MPYDVVFFDAELSEDDGSGLEFCRAYKHLYPQQDYFAIIVTSHTEFGRKGYASSAFRYIDKNNLAEEMKEAFSAIERVYMLRAWISVTPKRQSPIKLAVNDILAIETQGRNVCVLTKSGNFYVNEKLNNLNKMVENYGFYAIHRGIIINLRYVDKIYKDYLTLTGLDKRFEISRRNYSDFLLKLVEWKVEIM